MNNSIPPNVTIIYPQSNSVISSPNINFIANFSDNYLLSYANLLIYNITNLVYQTYIPLSGKSFLSNIFYTLPYSGKWSYIYTVTDNFSNYIQSPYTSFNYTSLNNNSFSNSNINQKNISKYSSKEVFLISDSDWKSVLELIPLTTWTGNETNCQKGYGSANNTCIYPTLIYHDENLTAGTYNFSSDDIINFKFNLDQNSLQVFPNSNNQVLHPGDNLTLFAPVYNLKNYSITLNNMSLSSYPSYLKLTSNQNFTNLNITIPTYNSSPNIIFNFTYIGSTYSFDADSIIYFMQQFSPTRTTVIGSVPIALANIVPTQTQTISPNDYLSYWNSYSNVVYVDSNYELALLASTYASLIDAPLVIKGTSLDSPSTFSGKNIICVGNVIPSGSLCNETYPTLISLQKKYLQMTNTDKIILVNPNDLNLSIKEDFAAEKSPSIIYNTYTKTSLSSGVLAAAKQELIISNSLLNYSDVNSVSSFIKNSVSSLNITTNYLTIIASPNAIEQSFNDSGTYYSADQLNYSVINTNPYLDVSVGRIFGISSSDVSSYIARDLFYSSTLKNNANILSTVGLLMMDSPSEIYSNGIMFSKLGYNSSVFYDPNNYAAPADWKNKFFIFNLGHGSTYSSGIFSSDIPLLDNSFAILESCLTCAFNLADKKNSLFCADFIRKGGIGYIGAVDESGYVNTNGIISEIFSQNSTIGDAFRDSKNSAISFSNNQNPMPWYTLIGDPTFILNPKYQMPSSKLNLIASDSNSRNYSLDLYSMKITVPSSIINLTQFPQTTGSDYFYSSSFNGQPNINYNFNSWFYYSNDFKPVAASLNWMIFDPNNNKFFVGPKQSNQVLLNDTYDGFKKYSYNFSLYNQAPDVYINNFYLTNQTLTFSIGNKGNQLGTANTNIFTYIYACYDDSCSYSNTQYRVYNSTIINLNLNPGDIQNISIALPSLDNNGNYFNSTGIKRFSINIGLIFPADFIQQNYYNDDWSGELYK